MSNGNPNKEAKEKIKLASKKESLLSKFKKSAETVSSPERIKINDLRSDLEVSQQKEGITLLSQKVVSALSKLRKKHPKANLSNPYSLDLILEKYKTELDSNEVMSIRKFHELISGKGPTSNSLLNAWPSMIKAGEDASKGWAKRLKESWEKDPVRTSLLVGIGFLGAWATYKVIKKAVGWFKGNKKEKSGPWLKKLLAMLGIVGAGAFFSKDQILKILGLKGLDDLKKMLKGGKFNSKKLEALRKKYEALKNAKDKTIAKVKELKKKTVETIKDPTTQFNSAKEIFLRMHFYNKRVFTPVYLGSIDTILIHLRSKKTKISELKKLRNLYRNKKEIPKSRFPVPTKNIKPKHLFVLTEGLLDIHKRFHGDKQSNETVGSLMIRFIADPIQKVNDTFHKEVLSKVNKGDFAKIFTGINYENISKAVREKKAEFIDAINKKVSKPENLSKDERAALRQIKLALFVRKTTVSENPDTAVSLAIASIPSTLKGKSPSEKVKLEAVKFYNAVKARAEKLIPKIHKRFGISEIDGTKVENHLKSNFSADSITFGNAIQLVLVTDSINWDEAEKGKMHWMKDFALLNIVLRTLDKNSRDKYVGQLSRVIAGSESSIKIPIPALQNLRPYVTKVLEYGKTKVVDVGLAILQRSEAWKNGRPSTEAIKKKPISVTFPTELGGGGAEMLTDTLALLLATARITPKQLGDIESAEEFFDLITKKGGEIIYPRTKDGKIAGPGLIAIRLYGKYFFTKPLGTLKKSMGALTDGDWGGAVKIWTVSSSPFIVIGAAKGALKSGTIPQRITRTLLGGLKGASYPVTAPIYGVDIARKGIEKGAGAFYGAAEYGKRPGRFIGNTWRWGASKIRYGKESRSLINLVSRGDDLKRYFTVTDFAGATSWEKWKEMFKSPRKWVSRIPGEFNMKMAMRYAKKTATEYNKFFKFNDAGVAGGVLPNLPKVENIKDIGPLQNTMRDIHNRFSQFRSHLENLIKSENFVNEMKDLVKSGAKGEGLSEKLVKLFTQAGFAENECKALAHQLKEQGSLSKFIHKLQNEGAKILKATEKANQPGIISRAAGKIRDMIRSNPAKLLASAEADLVKAVADVQKAKEVFDAAKTEDALRKALRGVEDAEASEKALRDTVRKLSKLKDAKKAVETGQTTAEAAKALVTAENAAEDAVRATTKAMEGAGKVSKLAKTLKVLGGGATGLGAVLSFYQSGKGFYEAATTNVKGRAGIEATHASLWAANGIADATYLAALISGRGLVLKISGKAAAVLAPLTYAGGVIYDTVKEGNLTSAEWAKSRSYDQLIHSWFGTLKSVSLGDAWVTGFKALGKDKVYAAQGLSLGEGHLKEVEISLAKKKLTLKKIFRVLVAAQANPDILTMDYSKTADKDKKVESMLSKTYSKYHEYYFRQEGAGMIGNYNAAKKFVTDAAIFNKVMLDREEKKKKGVKKFQIGPVNLMEAKYDFLGNVNDPKPKRDFMPSSIVKYYKKQMLSDIESRSKTFKENLDKMEPSYLGLLYVQIINKLAKAKTGKIQMSNTVQKMMMDQMTQIRIYLESKHNISYLSLKQNPKFSKTKMSLKELMKHVNGLHLKSGTSYKQFETQNVESKPGTYAIYKLAQYFGYTGNQNEKELKVFFGEKTAAHHGVYWNGSMWCVQEAGAERDEKIGAELNYETVNKIVTELYQNAEDVLENRHDRWFANAYDYSNQVKAMATLLQKSYNEGVVKYKSKGKMISHIAPTSVFKAKKFESKKDVAKDYGKEIDRLKNMAGWSKLEHKVINKNTIEIKRKGVSEKTTLKKSGDKWNLETYAYDLSFGQAVTLASLLNRIKKIVKGSKWKGGSSRPFEIDGKDIDFDKAGTPFDTTVIDGDRDGNHMIFMNRMGISHKKLIDTLNNWYQVEA